MLSKIFLVQSSPKLSTNIAYPNIPTKQNNITSIKLPLKITFDIYLGLLSSNST